MVNIFKLL